MSNEDNPSPIGSTIYRIKKEARVTLKPSRKTRTKTRKPKFLSLLCLDLSPENNPTSEMTTIHKQQLNLFPLHPENLVEDKDPHDENMAYLFSAEDGGDTTTLTGLLCPTDDSSSDENNNNLSPSSLKYACVGENGELLRTAMRNKERDASEDKWVFYSEVVERKDEEVTSCAADARCQIDQTRRLSLKLDYQEIMDAWSDKGSLYIHAESPQTVPELHNDILSPDDATNGLKDGWRSNGGLWTVPEYNVSNGNSSMDIKEDVEGGEKWKYRHREASVLRYKEKRQSRLFAKKIRYQVRKLNAEKRPRVKGRFVKRD